MKTHKYKRNSHGMNWITQHKRLAIYLRDGLACAYCGQSVEEGAQLTIDHIRPRSRSGMHNHERNLVTACHRCNTSKNARKLDEFAVAVSAYVNHGITPEGIKAHVESCRTRSLDAYMAEAKRLVLERGSASRALAHYKQQ